LTQSSHFSQFYSYDEALTKINQDVLDVSSDSAEKADLDKVFDTKVSFGARDS
jgi:hypothetical protein